MPSETYYTQNYAGMVGLGLLYGTVPPDPCFKYISTIRLSPPTRTSYIYPLTSTKIILTKLSRADTGIIDKTRESSTLKFMVLIV